MFFKVFDGEGGPKTSSECITLVATALALIQDKPDDFMNTLINKTLV